MVCEYCEDTKELDIGDGRKIVCYHCIPEKKTSIAFSQLDFNVGGSCVKLRPDYDILEFSNHTKFLSNFYELDRPFCIDGIYYPTSEHAYQASKTNDPKLKRKIAEAKTAARAKQIGYTEVTLPVNWDYVKVSRMMDILRVKFQNINLWISLMATEDRYIMEGNTWKDTYWGVCLKRRFGHNVLGQLLMRIRYEFKHSYTPYRGKPEHILNYHPSCKKYPEIEDAKILSKKCCIEGCYTQCTPEHLLCSVHFAMMPNSVKSALYTGGEKLDPDTYPTKTARWRAVLDACNGIYRIHEGLPLDSKLSRAVAEVGL